MTVMLGKPKQDHAYEIGLSFRSRMLSHYPRGGREEGEEEVNTGNRKERGKARKAQETKTLP